MGDENSSGQLYGWERYFTELSIFLNTAERQINTANQAYSEHVIERLERALDSMNSVIHHLLTVTPSSDHQATVAAHYASEISELAGCVREIATLWERRLDEIVSGRTHSEAAYSAPTESLGRGRPRFVITREQLVHLASLSFSWTQIAEILGVSRNTVYRRRLEYGLQDSRVETISDDELSSVILHLQQEFPAIGEVMVWGKLQSMGFIVRRERLRRTIRDPLHTTLRWRGQLTNRRLVRWRLVTHCSIDGYSRLIVFIKCSNNNCASTVHESFIDGVRRYGLFFFFFFSFF